MLKSLSWESVRGDEKWQATCTTQMTTAAHKVENGAEKVSRTRKSINRMSRGVSGRVQHALDLKVPRMQKERSILSMQNG